MEREGLTSTAREMEHVRRKCRFSGDIQVHDEKLITLTTLVIGDGQLDTMVNNYGEGEGVVQSATVSSKSQVFFRFYQTVFTGSFLWLPPF